MLQTREAQSLAGGFASGSFVHTRIPGGENIARIYVALFIAGVAATEAERKAQVSRIEIKRGSRTLVDVSPADLGALGTLYQNRRWNAPADDGILEIPFQCDEYETIGLRRSTVLGLGVEEYLDVKVHFSGTITIDSGEVWYEPTNEPAGDYIRTILSEPRNYNAAATDKFAFTRLQAGHRLKAAHVYLGVTPGVLASTRVIRNKAEVEKFSAAILDQKLSLQKLVQETGYEAIIFGLPELTPTASMQLNGVTELIFELEFSTAPGAGGYRWVWEILESQNPRMRKG